MLARVSNRVVDHSLGDVDVAHEVLGRPLEGFLLRNGLDEFRTVVIFHATDIG